MADNYTQNNYKPNAGYIDKEQLFWAVFGVGNEIKVITSKLPAGSDYDSRLKVINRMKRHVKSLGGKVLRTGFWNITPYPDSMDTSSAELLEDVALPF